MNAKSVKLIKRFVRESYGTSWDVKKIQREIMDMAPIERAREYKRMKDILEPIKRMKTDG